jgi:quercetin 2,3-dioxygenase
MFRRLAGLPLAGRDQIENSIGVGRIPARAASFHANVGALADACRTTHITCPDEWRNLMRYIENTTVGLPATDGAGVRLTRVIGTPTLDMIDPFLMLDEFGSDDPDAYMAGFPDHPHRGFETVTVMLNGKVRHGDSAGNDGVIGPGDVQWMTAGRGIVHSEMPEMTDGRMRGFQLWVNLPSALKMSPPKYQDISVANIPTARFEGGTSRVISGEYGGETGPADPGVPVRLMNVELDANGLFEVEPAAGSNVFVYVADGEVSGMKENGDDIGLGEGVIAVLSGEGGVNVRAGEAGAMLLYAEGEPIGEPVARYGPFVMNTRDEISQAMDDYRAGRFTG